MKLTMKKLLAAGILTLSSLATHAEYQQVNLTVFGMDCAPCAHAIHVSMKGIQGVNTVDVDLNTGLVTIKLTPGNSASMRQFNQAVEKNGFYPQRRCCYCTGQADRYGQRTVS
jgi:copper chaperone CopZ